VSDKPNAPTRAAEADAPLRVAKTRS
jgi:hypothetical protein